MGMNAGKAAAAVGVGGGVVAAGYITPVLYGVLVIGLVFTVTFAVVMLTAARSHDPRLQKNSAAVLDRLLTAARPPTNVLAAPYFGDPSQDEQGESVERKLRGCRRLKAIRALPWTRRPLREAAALPHGAPGGLSGAGVGASVVRPVGRSTEAPTPAPDRAGPAPRGRA